MNSLKTLDGNEILLKKLCFESRIYDDEEVQKCTVYI